MEESSFMSLPGTSWELVEAADRAELGRLARAIDALAADPRSSTPEDIALMMSGLSARILASVAGNERDLRDMIEALRGSGILVLGNGDLRDRHAAVERARAHGLDGALIGRATIGNPWALAGVVADTPTRLAAAIEHAELFERTFPNRPFVAARKHLHGYCRGFDGAGELRKGLMLAPNAAACRALIERVLLPMAA